MIYLHIAYAGKIAIFPLLEVTAVKFSVNNNAHKIERRSYKEQICVIRNLYTSFIYAEQIGRRLGRHTNSIREGNAEGDRTLNIFEQAVITACNRR